MGFGELSPPMPIALGDISCDLHSFAHMPWTNRALSIAMRVWTNRQIAKTPPPCPRAWRHGAPFWVTKPYPSGSDSALRNMAPPGRGALTHLWTLVGPDPLGDWISMEDESSHSTRPNLTKRHPEQVAADAPTIRRARTDTQVGIDFVQGDAACRGRYRCTPYARKTTRGSGPIRSDPEEYRECVS